MDVHLSLGLDRERPLGPVELLLECHDRIRRFSALAVKLATADAPPGEISEAASRVHHYFTVALPLHEQDEELSIRPRLLALRLPPDLADALAEMGREHVEIEDLLGECLEMWETLMADPSQRHAIGPELARASSRLEELFGFHLTAEEENIFPAVRELLPPEVQEELVAEIRQRRT